MQNHTIQLAAAFLLSVGLVAAADVTGQEAHVLPHVTHPHQILVRNGHLYVIDGVDGTRMLVYQLSNLQLRMTLGGDGDGPGHFRVRSGHRVGLDVTDDLILVTGGSKLARFTHTGQLIDETAFPFWTLWDFKAVGGQLVAQGSDADDYSYLLNLYDTDLTVVRELLRVPNVADPDRKIHVLTTSLQFAVQDQEIYAWGHTPDPEIRVYDKAGNESRVLSPAYDRIPVTDQVKSLVIDSYRSHPAFAGDIEEIQNRLVFPSHLPAIWQCFVDEDRVYVMTYWRGGDDGELFVLEQGGDIERRVRLAIPLSPAHTPYPATIHEGHWYQVIRDDARDAWRLRIVQLPDA